MPGWLGRASTRRWLDPLVYMLAIVSLAALAVLLGASHNGVHVTARQPGIQIAIPTTKLAGADVPCSEQTIGRSQDEFDCLLAYLGLCRAAREGCQGRRWRLDLAEGRAR